VEDELRDMEREQARKEGREVELPDAPKNDIEDSEAVKAQVRKDRAKAREEERRTAELLAA